MSFWHMSSTSHDIPAYIVPPRCEGFCDKELNFCFPLATLTELLHYFHKLCLSDP